MKRAHRSVVQRRVDAPNGASRITTGLRHRPGAIILPDAWCL